MVKLTESEVIKEGIDSLIRAGYYEDKEKLQDEAFRTLLEVRPELRTEVAIQLYKSKKVSLGRAAEIAGVSLEGMKTILKSRGIKIEIERLLRRNEKRSRSRRWCQRRMNR